MKLPLILAHGEAVFVVPFYVIVGIAIVLALASVAIGCARKKSKNLSGFGLFAGCVSCVISGVIFLLVESPPRWSDPSTYWLATPLVIGFLGVVLSFVRDEKTA